MTWLKRIGLFLTVNLLVMITISAILNLIGAKPYLTQYGMNYESLIVFCLIWGMGGAFISLALSRVLAKWQMGVKVIPPDTQNPDLRRLVQNVHELSRSARLPKMPEVGIYQSNEINAFATGPTKSRSLVAVSTGLLDRMNNDQVRGVLAHEVAHIANGDMVTLTLIQGVVNAFAMFLARIIAFALSAAKDGESRNTGFSYHIIQFALEMVFMVLGSMVVAWFSRYREYRADSGGARLAGRYSMIEALEGLKYNINNSEPIAQPAFRSLQISSQASRFSQLFSTHPPLEDRIAKLKRSY